MFFRARLKATHPQRQWVLRNSVSSNSHFKSSWPARIGAVPSLSAAAQATAKGPAYEASVPQSTLTELRYGKHPRNVLDFWKAESEQPTPPSFSSTR